MIYLRLVQRNEAYAESVDIKSLLSIIPNDTSFVLPTQNILLSAYKSIKSIDESVYRINKQDMLVLKALSDQKYQREIERELVGASQSIISRYTYTMGRRFFF